MAQKKYYDITFVRPNGEKAVLTFGTKHTRKSKIIDQASLKLVIEERKLNPNLNASDFSKYKILDISKSE